MQSTFKKNAVYLLQLNSHLPVTNKHNLQKTYNIIFKYWSENETLIASAIVNNNGFLDDIFVIPSYQGKGYGRLITQFAINKAISKGINKIETSVVEWNERAFKIYQSLGFSQIQTTHYYKLVKDEI